MNRRTFGVFPSCGGRRSPSGIAAEQGGISHAPGGNFCYHADYEDRTEPNESDWHRQLATLQAINDHSTYLQLFRLFAREGVDLKQLTWEHEPIIPLQYFLHGVS